MKEKISKIREAVHEELDFDNYKATNIRNNTSCYSHAIGSTLPFSEYYRIGAISGAKPIDEQYFSIEEIKYLLFKDFNVLKLLIEEVPNEKVELKENQYIIKLYVKIYREELGIFDYHFLRMDRNKIWSEKWWKHDVTILNAFSMIRYNNFFPWKYVATYRITR